LKICLKNNCFFAIEKIVVPLRKNNLIMPILDDGTFVIDDSPQYQKWHPAICLPCIYFDGQQSGTCAAYPKGIPDKFSTYRKTHNKIEDDQTGDFVYVNKNDKKSL
jgi:hypothetical protein